MAIVVRGKVERGELGARRADGREGRMGYARCPIHKTTAAVFLAPNTTKKGIPKRTQRNYLGCSCVIAVKGVSHKSQIASRPFCCMRCAAAGPKPIIKCACAE